MVNEHIVRMARNLKRKSVTHKAPIWKKVSEFALKTTVSKRVINVNGIEKLTKDGDVVVFPGKVLGTGDITHSISLFCFDISRTAASKVRDAGGRILDYETLTNEKPTGTGVILLG
ncbi:MAG: 50S ribosomal protein L18e [Cenarchaeum sp. SB0665_bin_23]|nr:50S ribosomal protein L18e [Cenarchaeum sp. SB0665_bin_23]MXZ93594.1 50S ribosomal protein L18e [Cenarchaeum sp. SB0666_bin_15]MYB47374.1 50S ribosomal protein L18e [Cenarchaeum sp. SB0662_bin_33]MYD58553.1 50S ribosomal protein L18e [Cenarchaeum sp. SB0678_bin_8]MYG33121.1 50S ribosomal protein L18e [Cenarchaeum sp. SB0677_bin_16]MYJ28173.1 50S ribosomal protein L18e [Cenarchaeum sp. SB0672_bin_9]